MNEYRALVKTGPKNLKQIPKSENAIPFIRTQNIRPFYLDMSGISYTTIGNVKTTDVNDLLFVRVGVGVGDCSIIKKDQTGYAFSDNVIRAKIQPDVNSEYLAIFLNLDIGKSLLQREQKGSGKPVISYENLRNLKVPVPPRPIQDRVAEIMEEAYRQRKEKLKKAEDLLAGIHDYVLDKLGIAIPEMDERQTFVVMLKDLKEGKRHDAFYYQPKYTAALSALEKSEWETKPLKDVTEISSETRDPTKTPEKPFVYVEISDVDTKLGEITLYKELNGKEAPSRARMVIRKGDIVVSTTRPYRGAIAIVPDMLDDSI